MRFKVLCMPEYISIAISIARAWVGSYCQFCAATLEAMLTQNFVTLVVDKSVVGVWTPRPIWWLDLRVEIRSKSRGVVAIHSRGVGQKFDSQAHIIKLLPASGTSVSDRTSEKNGMNA